jgi:uncharacterized membrane protein
MTLNVRNLFVIGAVVLIVLALIAAADATGTAIGVQWNVWLCGSLLSFFASLLVVDRRPVP